MTEQELQALIEILNRAPVTQAERMWVAAWVQRQAARLQAEKQTEKQASKADG